MTFARNLARARKASQLTQEGLALACGWTGQSRIANYERGIREPSISDLELLSAALNVPISDLIGEDRHQKNLLDPWQDINAYAQSVGLSDGAEALEYAETHRLKFRADSLARKRLDHKQLAVMYGKGDSMEPRIRDGDAILFDTSDTQPRDEAIFVVQVPGAGANALSAKRCELIGDIVTFRADNPYGDHGWRKPRRMDDPRSPISIIGRVRWIGSWEGS